VTASPEAVGREAALLAGVPSESTPVPTVSLIWNPAEVARLRTLLLEVASALDSAPGPLHPEAVANMDRTLLRALAGVTLDNATGRKRGRSLRVERSAAFRSIFEFLRTLSPGPVYIEDLCRATGLPERTLRFLFLEQFGESPVRVLRARRLCLTYEALREPGVGLKQIRQVAGRYGFWHMGQFAADYRALFGERPSDTVRRARQNGPRSRALRAVPDMAALPRALAAAR
jgi:AraC family ethanolamine operon transcriptional activator